MNFNSVISSMDQQARVLKDIQNLLDHNDKQTEQAHSVKPEDIEALQNYVAGMQRAVDTATALAKHYNNTEKTQPTKTETEQSEKPKTKKRGSADNKPAEKKEPADDQTSAPAGELITDPVDDQTDSPPTAQADPPLDDEFDFLN